ncbi:MAG: glycosyltransferase [Ignavibacteriales bacterium]|nr:glycosyltransferase [Ignavibacteriales bacterium]
MKILQIAPQVPYPLVDGGKVGIFNITKHLAQRGHEITLLCFKRDETADISELSKYCRIFIVPHSTKNSVFGLINNLFNETPYNISKYMSVEMEKYLRRLLSTNRFDIVHVDHLHMAHYGVLCKKEFDLPIVLREHNIESTIMERFAKTVKIPIVKMYLEIQRKRIEYYESKMTQEFDLCAVITDSDNRRLNRLQPLARTAVIPGGVGAQYFVGGNESQREPFTMSMFGGFDWIPNQDALTWFVEEMMPNVVKKYHQAKLIVIGKNVPRKIMKYESEHIVFRGFVADLKTEVQRYQMTLAPLRIGGGIRLKILESFAMKTPVVSTSVGCEGIECNDGKEILIGDTPDQFVQRIFQLFEDQKFRTSIAENAYNLALQKYTWERIAECFEKSYIQINSFRIN